MVIEIGYVVIAALVVGCGSWLHWKVIKPLLRFSKQVAIANRRAENVGMIPKYLEGLVKVAEAQVAAVEKQTEAVDRLTIAVERMRRMMFNEDESQPARPTSVYGREAAALFGVDRQNMAWAEEMVRRQNPDLAEADILLAAERDLTNGEVTTPGY